MIRTAAALKDRMESGNTFIIASGTSASVIYPNGQAHSVAMNAFRALRSTGYLKSYIHEYNETNREIRYTKA